VEILESGPTDFELPATEAFGDALNQSLIPGLRQHIQVIPGSGTFCR
jgi:hypothetical protein